MNNKQKVTLLLIAICFAILSCNNLVDRLLFEEYSINYNSNGATSGTVPVAQTKIQGTAVTLATVGDLVKTGYTFAGWNTKADGSGITYPAGVSYEVDTDASLYAKWELCAYTISYDKNGATSGTVSTAHTKIHGNAITLATVGNLVKTGYILASWNTKADGTGTDYAAGSSYEIDESLVLYAKWTAAVYSLSFDNQDGNGGTTALYEKYDAGWYTDSACTTVATTIVTPTKANNAFGGYYNNAECNGTAYINADGNMTESVTSTFITENTTLFAKWLFEGNGSGGAVASTGVTINGQSYEKTAEIVVIAAGKTGYVAMTDDSSWNSYSDGSDDRYKGVFIKGRNVTLDAFAIGQYEVTQELYKAVLASDDDCNASPSKYRETGMFSIASGEVQEKRPVETVTWYDAIYFCNALTKKTMTEADCVYTITNIQRDTANHMIDATVTMDITKKGYRLPTEAEWEFAARGGDPNKDSQWKKACAGVYIASIGDFTDSLTDTELDHFAWYESNSAEKTHEVGKKTANSLCLYDMSGNVCEWCWDWYLDWYNDVVATDIPDLGDLSGVSHVVRGGSYDDSLCFCSVSSRNIFLTFNKIPVLGFRLARSL